MNLQRLMEWGLSRTLHKIETSRFAALSALQADIVAKKVSAKRNVMRTDNILRLVFSSKMQKPDVLVCGESNAGKSSFLGEVVFVGGPNERRHYDVSRKAGSTRKINRVNVADLYTVTDTPGYGYVDRRSWKAVMAQSFLAMTTALTHQYIAAMSASLLHRVYVLVQAHREGLSAADLRTTEVCAENGVPFSVVVTKCDLVSQSDLYKTVQNIKEQIPGVEVMLFSIKDATSIRDAQLDILHSVTRWLDEEDLTYSTLRRLEYNTPPPSTSEVQAIMEKYQRPLTADERDAATLRALGRTPNNETREQLKKLQARFDVEAALLKEDLARVQREERLKRGEYTAHQPQGRGARIVTSADDIKGVEDVFTETPKFLPVKNIRRGVNFSNAEEPKKRRHDDRTGGGRAFTDRTSDPDARKRSNRRRRGGQNTLIGG